MSASRRQALIDAPVESIWELVGNPARHPEWWPRVVEVRGERFRTDDRYVQVTRTPFGTNETTLSVERLEDLREIRLLCLDTGTYATWRLTPAQGNTFVDVELGTQPESLSGRVIDRVTGQTYFRRWVDQSLEALRAASAKT